MAKTMEHDGQILLNIMMVQEKMRELIDSFDSNVGLIADKPTINLLTYYIIRLFSLRKNFSTKTKKDLNIFDDDKYALISKHMISCFPLISDAEILDLAYDLSDLDAIQRVADRYAICINVSNNE